MFCLLNVFWDFFFFAFKSLWRLFVFRDDIPLPLNLFNDEQVTPDVWYIVIQREQEYNFLIFHFTNRWKKYTKVSIFRTELRYKKNWYYLYRNIQGLLNPLHMFLYLSLFHTYSSLSFFFNSVLNILWPPLWKENYVEK